MDRVAFIDTEDGDDLIVSFAITEEDFGSVQSVTLMRTPKYEMFLEEWERGVRVSDERSPDAPDDGSRDVLRELRLEEGTVVLKTDDQDVALDLSKVDPEEIAEARRILKKMNFDRRFKLSEG